ncbi:hypothetical protein A3K86_20610 [Photobacterium jeanii]|uniref:VanZ-like domain-containing protein n=1 Tax=Photobacterium jeanii TaxID=858640 RepID=A0A178K3P7_9GAMM|nr:VanZ family protein [Photobacterium jeanii]OAN11354.1 hypothetical protein A3K86_20610 [Photobacterium jeanii]PST90873.1 hypothetical protein C9I91_09715 [Photobacterium jeanii]
MFVRSFHSMPWRYLLGWIIFIAYFFFITIISLLPGAEEKSLLDLNQYGILFLDKMLHVAAYGLFALLGYFLGLTPRLYIALCLLLAGYGLLLEWLQGWLIVNREASMLDALANLVGILMGAKLTLWRLYSRSSN